VNAPLITLTDIAVRQRDRWLLNGLSWRIHRSEQWVMTGPNGAGKTTLAKAIAGLLPVVQGRIHYHGFGEASPLDTIAYVASDARRDIWRQERALAYGRDFAGRFDEATLTRQFLEPFSHAGPGRPDPMAHLTAVADRCDIEALLERPLMALSTGELSRVLIARQLLRRPRMLILDEPFEGLDSPGRLALMAMLERLAAGGLTVLLITHRAEERLSTTTHALELIDGRIAGAGPLKPHRDAVLMKPTPAATAPAAPIAPIGPQQRAEVDSVGGDPLIEMREATVRYGRSRVLDRVTWTVHAGQHWAITGANGAGKTTLLQLVTGDCLQVHANRIRLFGHARGPHQPLAAVRRQLGVVSHALAAGYQKRMSALDVVCSGFFDSVGLYRYCDAGQVDAARLQLEQMDAADLARVPFNYLSQGQRQLVLIARAMVKRPRLLLLDEPLSGLDPENRARVRSLLTAIGQSGTTGLIVVSHHSRDIVPLTTHHLILDRGRVVYCGAFRRA
jgi:molybdate transport system ATP-binding protein